MLPSTRKVGAQVAAHRLDADILVAKLKGRRAGYHPQARRRGRATSSDPRQCLPPGSRFPAAASRDANGSTAIDVGASRASQPNAPSAVAAARVASTATGSSHLRLRGPAAGGVCRWPRPGRQAHRLPGGSSMTMPSRRPSISVVLAQPLAKMSGVDPDHRVAVRIEVASAAKDVDRHDAFLDLTRPAFRVSSTTKRRNCWTRGAPAKEEEARTLSRCWRTSRESTRTLRRRCGTGRRGCQSDADVLNVLRLFQIRKLLKYQDFSMLNTPFNGSAAQIATTFGQADPGQQGPRRKERI